MNGQITAPDIRAVLLQVIQEQKPRDSMSQTLQQSLVLNEASLRLFHALNPPTPPNDPMTRRYGQQPPILSQDMQEALLTQWGELFRTGLLAWGLNLSNPESPYFHMTESGRTALANASRDPSNPAGYIRHLDSRARINPVCRSYLIEALDCYVAGLRKAAAVMIGAAAEALILELAEHTYQRLLALGHPPKKGLKDWRIKTVSDTLRSIFEVQRNQMKNELRESVDANWPAFSYQIRATRNEAGHPTSVDSVTPDRVHAALLIFPEMAKLAENLTHWITSDLE